MIVDYSGLCKKCKKWYRIIGQYDERTQFGYCPIDYCELSLTRKSLNQVKEEIWLSPSEIGKDLAIIKNYK